VLVAGRAKFKDVIPEDFRQPANLIAKLDARADVTLPEGLVTMPWGIKADSAAHTQMQMRQKHLAALAEQGYIQRTGPMIRSTLELSNGQFNVNGKPFDSQALQVPPSRRPAVQRHPANKSRAPDGMELRSLR
jgi:uncharacterized protein DUF945